MRNAAKNLLGLLLCGVVFSNCNAFDFDVNRVIDEVIIPGDPAAAATNALLAPDVIPPQSWDQALPQEPSAIFVEGFELRITSTSNNNDTDTDDFSWIERIVFYAESTRPNSSLGRHPIAWTANPGAVLKLELKTNRALNLVPYLLEGLQVSSSVEGRVPEDDVSLVGTARLSVDAL